MSDNKDNHEDDWGDDDKTRIQLPKKTSKDLHSNGDLIGSGEDATAYKKPHASQAGTHDRESAKTERAQTPQEKKTPKTRIKQKLTGKDATKAAASRQKAPKNTPRAQDTLKNRFVLGRVLGAGGMGVVYKAKDLLKVEAKDRDPYVAIKVLGEEFKSHPEAFIALQRESRKTQKIAHPNIVNVYDFDKDGDTVFMTMEFLDGSPLDKLIKKHKTSAIPREQAWDVLQGICSALAYAHEQNIIHADLKPGNIFVTPNNIAKVFDFGIARAVANAEQMDLSSSHEDKTFFDAGNLGALTPAYASLEMLLGQTPDIRDDVYALGCIAYELFTGKHPYQRKNAQDAQAQGLKPEKIKNISKQQWRAIEKALSFERESRISSASELWQLLSEEQATPYKTWLALFIIVLFSGYFTYDSFFKPEPIAAPTISAEDVANEAGHKVRVEIAEARLQQILKNAIFDERWETELHQALLHLIKLIGQDDQRVVNSTAQAYELYLSTIESDIQSKNLEQAKKHISNARRYTQDFTTLSELEGIIAKAIEQAGKDRLAQQAQAAKKAALKNKQSKINKVKQKEVEQKRQAYNVALANVNEQLKCTRSLNMNNFSIAINKLRNIDNKRYKSSETNIISGLVSCIKKVARNFPPRAESSRKAALTLFRNNKLLKGLTIRSKDPCREGLAGQGARGKRSICRDSIKSGGKGPRLVIIPSKGKIPVFAIGKYEVSATDMNLYCTATKACKETPIRGGVLPATNLSIKQAKAYLKWLSKSTGKTYRLPSSKEWVLAAKAKGSTIYSNRNCKLNSRGIQKGGALVNAEVGQQNSWGLVNHIGNAQEWVIGPGKKLLIAGGSYNTQMDQCTPNWQQSSSGQPEKETGFRVLRELRRK